MNEPMITTALYARVSSEKQESEETINSQIQTLKDFAKKNGMVVVQEYRDDGYSGDLLARPGLDRLRDDANRKLFQNVLILSPDRLARTWYLGELVQEELKRFGITTTFTNQKDDGSDESKLLLGITGLFAQYEKAKMMERVRRGRIHKAKSGLIVTSRAPYGYRYIPKSAGTPGYLVINPETAEVVRLIFRLRADQGMGLVAIVDELAKRNIPPQGRDGPKKFWAKSSINKILAAETYCGRWYYQKHYSAVPERRTPGTKQYQRMVRTSRRLRDRSFWIPVDGIPPIIDRDLFERSIAQAQKNKVFSKRNAQHNYLLKGLAKCATCGMTYQGVPDHGVYFYRCNNRAVRRSERNCWNGPIMARKVESAVWIAIKDAMLNPQTIIGQLPKVLKAKGKSFEDREATITSIRRQREAINEAEDRLLDALTGGIITADQFREQMAKQKAKMEAINEKEMKIESVGPSKNLEMVPSVEAFCRELSKGFEVLEKDEEKKQQFLRLVVDEVSMKPGAAVVRGAIPIARAGQSLDGNIVSTPAACYGRNTEWPFELAVNF